MSDSSVALLVKLCGRLQLDGGFDPPRAPGREVEHVLHANAHDRSQYFLTIREDSLEAYTAARSAALDSDGNLPPGWKAPLELLDDGHRFEQLVTNGSCSFKLGQENTRRGKRLIQRNKGVTIAVGEALPCNLATAVSLLTRYPAVLEPIELPQPEPVKIERKPTRRKAANKE